MALSDLIRTLKQGDGGTIVPMVDRFLLQRNYVRSDVEEWIHPSSMEAVEDMCPRSMFFDLYTPLEIYPVDLLTKEHSPRTHRIFENGMYFHRRWQMYFVEMGICDPRVRTGWEVPIVDEKLAVKGHTDAIIYPDALGKNQVRLRRAGLANGEIPIGDYFGGVEYEILDPVSGDWVDTKTDFYLADKNPKMRQRWWKPYGTPMLVELKSMHEYGWKNLISPLPKHQVQATAYTGVLREQRKLDLREVLFLYECKNTQEPKEFKLHFNSEIWAGLKAALYKVQKAKREGKLPSRICRSALDSPAQVCNWTDLCFAVDTYQQLIKKAHAKKKSVTVKKTPRTGKK